MEEIDSIKKFIKRVTLIPEQEVDDFIAQREYKSFKKGEYVIREGQFCKELFFLHQGIFRYVIITDDGDNITKDFSIDTSNSFSTAYTSLFFETPSHIYIEAMEDCVVSVWHSDFLLPFLNSNLAWQTFSQRMAAFLYMRKEKREISFLKDDAPTRYHQFLKDFPSLDKRIPQHYIASYLGIKPETLSRIRRRIDFSKH